VPPLATIRGASRGRLTGIGAISDDSSRDWITDVDGNRVVDHDHINRARLRVDSRKWVTSKLKPRKYGDKLLHTGGDGEGPVAVKLALDYSLLAPAELLQLKNLILKATPKPAAEPLQIEGEVAEDGE
jgi:Bacteriophage Sf6, terminase small subunit-like